MYTHDYQILKAGIPAAQAKGALIMLHGRGATARSIVTLSDILRVDEFAIYAPQATNNSWYPYSFMAKEEDNQPALNAALEVIGKLVDQIVSEGIQQENIFFFGFSQGACLTLEYVTRNAQRYGGVMAFTGGLIGESLYTANYSGSFEGTPVLLTTGDPDPHVPLTRVEESLVILKAMGADLSSMVFKGRQHTILTEELDLANKLIFNK
jgi:phospholipase/carboxylesterase